MYEKTDTKVITVLCCTCGCGLFVVQVMGNLCRYLSSRECNVEYLFPTCLQVLQLCALQLAPLSAQVQLDAQPPPRPPGPLLLGQTNGLRPLLRELHRHPALYDAEHVSPLQVLAPVEAKQPQRQILHTKTERNRQRESEKRRRGGDYDWDTSIKGEERGRGCRGVLCVHSLWRPGPGSSRRASPSAPTPHVRTAVE